MNKLYVNELMYKVDIDRPIYTVHHWYNSKCMYTL